MPFCENCGEEVSENAKFCINCGTEIKKREETREIVFEGEIHKCPHCGEVLNSFDIKCPSCGFELNNKSISKTLQDFIEKVNECEKNISDNPSSKSGWSSWSKGKKFWFIIGNLFFAFIPLIIYFSVPLIKIKSTPKLSKEESQLVSLVENFPFPNERESIIEAMMFAKGKMDFLATKEINRKNAYWFNLWKSKANQLKQKTDLLLPNDPIVNQTYNQILEKNNEINKKIKIKIGIGMVMFLMAVIVFFYRNGTIGAIKDSNTKLIVPQTTLSDQMPQIENGKGKVLINSSDFFSVEYFAISESDFEEYKKHCIEKGYTIDAEKSSYLYEAYDSQGYKISVLYTSYSKGLSITITNKEDFRELVWPENGIAKEIPKPKSNIGKITSSSDTCFIGYISETSLDDFRDYIYECTTTGFNNNISQGDKYFRAENKDGTSIHIDYEGFNVIYIRVDK